MKLGKGYYAYLVLGLIAVVAVCVISATSSDDPSGADAMPWIIGSIAAFVIGLLIFQWRGVAKAAPSSGPDAHAARAGHGADDAGAIDDYNELMTLMASEDYDAGQVASGRGETHSMMRGYMVMTTIIVLLCLVLGGLGVTGNLPNLGESGFIRYVPFLLAPLAFAYIRFVMSRSTGAAQEQLAPLGLAVTETPDVGLRPDPFRGSGAAPTVTGATVMEGARHGRNVAIRMDGRRHRTTVQGAVPDFEIAVRRGGQLAAKDGAPPAVSEAVAGLQPSKHWKDLKSVKGGPAGIEAERKVTATQNWLWDLWLCERLAERSR